jgi:endonuclease YncB( thermonuclease family)
VIAGEHHVPGYVRNSPRFWLLLLVLVGLGACGEPPGTTGRVTRIFDGDSLIVRTPMGQEVEVRLFGIDAPERSQPWNRRSRQALGKLVRDREVSLEVVTVDAYGRTVALVRRTSDDLEVNREMVRQGHAWVYRRYTQDPSLIALEEAARDERRGIWSLPETDRVPPWAWRKQNRRPRQREQEG